MSKDFNEAVDVLFHKVDDLSSDDNRVIKKKTFDYGYALTVHKSQGSSFNTVFVDIANINACSDEKVLRQLQYVAISRTKGDVYLLV